VRAWKTYYGTSTNFNGGSTAFDNFYTNNTTNSTLTIVAGSLNLSYGDANQFYTSDGGTSTTFTLNVKATTSLSDVFKSNDGSISIPTDTNTSKIVYIIPPK
jgi:ABC-type oligopeptide transport system substrate-binding subunit